MMTVLGLQVCELGSLRYNEAGPLQPCTLETLHASCISPTPAILPRASHLPFPFVRVDGCCAEYSR
jgi:hypothetical protein